MRPRAGARALVAWACGGLAACAGDPAPEPPPAAAPPPPLAAAPAPGVAPDPPAWHAAARPLSAEERAAMTGPAWREGCPVGLDDLVRVELAHHLPTGGATTGVLVVHRRVETTVVAAFHTLWDLGFPIARMEPVERYGGSDEASMEANNTSAFNCREKTGGGGFSRHSHGTAVDVNPLWNPYVKGERVEPPSGRPWLDRARPDPGLFHPGGPEVRAFTDLGWGWGGGWATTKDYQHFSDDGT